MKPGESSHVQYGCGLSAPAGWLNFDASPTLRLQRIPVLGRFITRGEVRFPAGVSFGDVVRGLPLAEGSCQGIYCSHVLEHLALAELKVALRNTFECLAAGGTFRLVMPDLEQISKEYVAASDPGAALRFMEATQLGAAERPRGLRAFIRSFLGNSRHLWLWDEASIRVELEAAGFIDIRRARFGDSEDDRFGEVEEEDRWTDALGMECRRP